MIDARAIWATLTGALVLFALAQLARADVTTVDCGDFSTAVVQNVAGATAAVSLNGQTATPLQLPGGGVITVPCSGTLTAATPTATAAPAVQVVTSPWGEFSKTFWFMGAGLVCGGAVLLVIVRSFSA